MQPRFEQFIRERQYFANVSPATIEKYRHCLRWLPCDSPTQADVKAVIVQMRAKGSKETSVNTVIRTVNAYLHWSSGTDSKCGPGCTHPRVPQLREPKQVMPTLGEPQIKRIVAWKPKSRADRRLHCKRHFLAALSIAFQGVKLDSR